MAYMEIKSLKVELPRDVQFLLAQSHFIKTIEDVVSAKRVILVW
jgi:adenosine/AMP kinase